MLYLSKSKTKSKDPTGCGIGPKNSAGCALIFSRDSGSVPPIGGPCSQICAFLWQFYRAQTRVRDDHPLKKGDNV